MSGFGTRTSEAAPTVLVIEDEALVRAAAVAYLLECGFSVLEAPATKR
jgi:hypothetical protein